MDEFEESLQRASASLSDLVEGPGLDAANILEQAFGRAGTTIEQALSRAARAGELDFKSMTESILTDLARIAAEAVTAQSGRTQTTQPLTLNMNVGAGANAASVVGAAGSIASAVAAAAARGARYG